MNSISIFLKICERSGKGPLAATMQLTERGERIIRHYQRWYDKSRQSAYDLDFAITRCIADLAGANGGDGEQRTEVRL